MNEFDGTGERVQENEQALIPYEQVMNKDPTPYKP
jgi:hypothetical protein